VKQADGSYRFDCFADFFFAGGMGFFFVGFFLPAVEAVPSSLMSMA